MRAMSLKRDHHFDDLSQGRRIPISPTTANDSRRLGSSSSPRQFPHRAPQPYRDSTSSSPSSSSPGPFLQYAFPAPSRACHASSTSSFGQQGSSPIGPSHRESLPIPRSRRSSPFLHEIQPPSRRLSSHQMLLLTPFGGVLPPGASLQAGPSSALAMESSAAGMTRGASSVERAPALSRAPPMAFTSSHLPPPLSRSHPTRTRYLSFPAPTAGPSPLASAPMTTIPSASETGSSSGASSAAPSREPSNQDARQDRMPSLVGGVPTTVPMTRSNSLPVLTLRELHALSQKDGELGIARGGGWAWVEREIQEEIPDDDPSPRGSLGSVSTSYSASSTVTPPSMPSSLSQFTMFSDPFASSSSSMARETPNIPLRHHISATAAGYHYSPTQHDTRRMSEAATTVHSSPINTTGRRPSAPIHIGSSARSSLVSSFASSSGSGSGSGSGSAASTTGPSPRGSTIVQNGPLPIRSASPVRPKITRYKSLPGRHEGLGLQIVVKPQASTSGPPTSGTSATLNDRRSSEVSTGSRGTGRPSKGRLSGTWAAVDVVDSFAATEIATSSRSSFSSNRDSLTSTSPTTVTPGLEGMFMVEEITSRAHLAEFGAMGDLVDPVKGKGKAKERLGMEGAEMSTPTVARGFVAQLAQSGWNATFPRRGSLAVLTRTALAPWAMDSEMGGLGVGDKDRVGRTTQHWSERRGSWAEGWSKP